MAYNESILRGAMARNKMTIKQLATKMELSPTGFFNKLSGAREFTITEAQNLSKILNLSDAERDEIFFAVDDD